jgi:muramoyltetrapeptide carboxypeptidase
MTAAYRIGVVALGGPIAPALAERAAAVCAEIEGLSRPVELVFHPQCFAAHGHFAGPDDVRAAAFVAFANDPSLDAMWFARGGYGAGRVIPFVLPHLGAVARAKKYLGYSDVGVLFAALYRAGFERLAHGPLVVDLTREGGQAAIARALAWLVDGDASTLEPSLDERPAVAFNMIVFSQLLGTPYEPDLTGHVLMLEEVGEYMYRIDRSLFHIASSPSLAGLAGLRLGRCSGIPVNEPDFGRSEDDIAAEWCARAGIAYLGRADIGHDIDNKIVPFGPRP